MEWWSIEVLNGPSSAAWWKDGHGEALVEAALTNGRSTGPGTSTAGA